MRPAKPNEYSHKSDGHHRHKNSNLPKVSFASRTRRTDSLSLLLLCLRLRRCILNDRSHEAIPSSSKRLNEDRFFRRFAKGVAQPLDGRIQALIQLDEAAVW